MTDRLKLALDALDAARAKLGNRPHGDDCGCDDCGYYDEASRTATEREAAMYRPLAAVARAAMTYVDAEAAIFDVWKMDSDVDRRALLAAARGNLFATLEAAGKGET